MKVLRYHLSSDNYAELKSLAGSVNRTEPDVMRDALWLGLPLTRPPIPYKVFGPVVPRATTVSNSFRNALNSRARKLFVEKGQLNSFVNEIARNGLAAYRKEVQLFRAEVGPVPEGERRVAHDAVEQDAQVKVLAVQDRHPARRQRSQRAVLSGKAAARADDQHPGDDAT